MHKHPIRVARDAARFARYNRSVASWLNQVQIPTIDGRGQRVVFNTVRASLNNAHIVSDFLVGHLLARNGSQVHILLDDGVLQHWDSVQFHQSSQNPLNPMRALASRIQLKRQFRKFADTFATDGLSLLWYSDFIDNPAAEQVDADLEAQARMSTMRFFQKSSFSYDDTAERRYFERSIQNALVSRSVGRYAATALNASVFATSHGVYSTWGPAYQFARAHGVSTKVYTVHPYRNGGLMIQDAPAGHIDQLKLEEYLDSAPFDSTAREFAQSYLQDRFAHNTSDTKEYFSQLTAGTATDRAGELAAKSKNYDFTFVLFPNVAWDAIGEHTNGIYHDVVDWIADTARCIGSDQRKNLIVRMHPAEVTRAKGTTPAFDLVKQVFPEIDRLPNVDIVHAHEAINSYDLIRDAADIALVFTGTLGGESQVLGVPVVTAARGRFSKRFVTSPSDSAQYRKILEDPSELIAQFAETRQQVLDSVLKYHYYINDEMYFPIGLFSKEDRLGFNRRLTDNPANYDLRGMKKTLNGLIT